MRMSSRSMRAGAIALVAVMMSSMVACSGPSASEKASASFHNSVSAARDALFEEAKLSLIHICVRGSLAHDNR